jgi:protein-tyrosine phosphatase
MPGSILFVCTGNTCRSPLAAGLCRTLLAARLGCQPGDLDGMGWVVQSAGVAAWPGDPATPAAVLVASEHGADLTAHRSRAVTPELLAQATHVVAMTRGHAAALAARFPGVGPAAELIGGPADDLPDPIGGDLAVYRACADTLRAHLDRHLTAWLTTGV